MTALQHDNNTTFTINIITQQMNTFKYIALIVCGNLEDTLEVVQMLVVQVVRVPSNKPLLQTYNEK